MLQIDFSKTTLIIYYLFFREVNISTRYICTVFNYAETYLHMKQIMQLLKYILFENGYLGDLAC